MSKDFKLTKRHERALSRIAKNGPLRRQADATEAGAIGGGYIFWTDRDGKRMPPASCRQLIEQGLLVPLQDGLFDGSMSQSFSVQNDRPRS